MKAIEPLESAAGKSAREQAQKEIASLAHLELPSSGLRLESKALRAVKDIAARDIASLARRTKIVG